MRTTAIPAIAIVAALAGCSTPHTSATTDPTIAATQTPLPASIPSAEPEPEDGIGTAPSLPPANAALLAATTYVRLWARPGLDRTTWYHAVRPWVTSRYGQLLADTDPVNVPAHAVTGVPRPVSSTTAVLVADVPTDAGLIRVTATDIGGRWLIASARPFPAS
jgi:hypothetical protein